jgi:hypothetical protein
MNNIKATIGGINKIICVRYYEICRWNAGKAIDFAMPDEFAGHITNEPALFFGVRRINHVQSPSQDRLISQEFDMKVPHFSECSREGPSFRTCWFSSINTWFSLRETSGIGTKVISQMCSDRAEMGFID